MKTNLGTALDLADCTLVVKRHSEIGDETGTLTIGIKFKAGDETYGCYREYTSHSTLADVCRDLTDMLNKKNEVQRMCNECNIDARTCPEPSKKQTLMQAYNEGRDT